MNVNRKKGNDRCLLKSRIIDYARNAFGNNGIRDVTMDSIAGALSISKRTLYEIFKDKEELLLEIIRLHSVETQAFIDSIFTETDNILDIILKIYERNFNEIKKVNRVFFDEIEKYPSVIKFLQDTRTKMASFTILCFNRGVEQGLFRKDVNYEIIRIGMTEEMDLLLKLKAFEKYSILEIYENVVFIHIRGIATEKGLKIVEEFFQKI